MSIHRNSNTPHLFYPETAKKFGLAVAVVEMAIMEIGYRGEKEPPRNVELHEVLERCWFLSDDDVYEAFKLLRENGAVTEAAE